MYATTTIQERLRSGDAVALVHQWLQENPGQNRQALARYLCEALNLKDARGQWRMGGTVKALRVLEARGYWRLPKAENAHRHSGRWRPRGLGRPVPVPQAVPARAEQVQGLKLVEVTRAQKAMGSDPKKAMGSDPYC